MFCCASSDSVKYGFDCLNTFFAIRNRILDVAFVFYRQEFVVANVLQQFNQRIQTQIPFSNDCIFRVAIAFENKVLQVDTVKSIPIFVCDFYRIISAIKHPSRIKAKSDVN